MWELSIVSRYLTGKLSLLGLFTHIKLQFLFPLCSIPKCYTCWIIFRLVQQNNYSMKEWHFEHMQKQYIDPYCMQPDKFHFDGRALTC
jgi:hypothetical protein